MPARRHALLAILCLLALVGGSASAGPPGTWTQINTTEIRNLQEASLVRGGDGNLQIVFQQANVAVDTEADLVVRRVDASGVVGALSTVTTGWSAMTYGPEITVEPDGTLKAWWHGIDAPGDGTFVSTGDASGSTWSAPIEVANGLGGSVSVVKLADGTYFQAGAGEVHRGLDPNSPVSDYQAQFNGCCSYGSRLAFDEATGKLWHVWMSNATGAGGIWAQEVDLASGAPVGTPQKMPGLTDADSGDSFISDAKRVAAVSRPGGGAYVVHPGGYPDEDRVMVWKIGDAAAYQLKQDAAIERHMAISADADGRLWVVWWEDSGDRERVFASVSNAAATGWSPAHSVAAPPVTDPVPHYLAVLAQTNRIDIVGNVLTRSGVLNPNGGLFHTQLPSPPEWTTGPDTLTGTSGADFLYGGGGRDELSGGGGRDDLYGGAGGDKLNGGAGKDLLNGGGGRDTCIFTTGDTLKSCEVKVRRGHLQVGRAAGRSAD